MKGGPLSVSTMETSSSVSPQASSVDTPPGHDHECPALQIVGDQVQHQATTISMARTEYPMAAKPTQKIRPVHWPMP